MAERRGFKAGLAGAFSGASEAFGGMLRQLSSDQRAKAADERIHNRELLDKLTDDVRRGIIEPAQAEETLRANGFQPREGMFDSLQPSTATRLQSVLGPIEGAKNVADVPSPTGVVTAMRAKRVPFFSPGQIDSTTGKSSGGFTPEGQRALDLRQEKLDSFPAIGEETIEPTTGAKFKTYTAARDANKPRTIQTGLGAEQEGTLAGKKSVAQLLAESIGGAPAMRGQAAGEESVAQLIAESVGGAPAMRGQAASKQSVAQLIAESVSGAPTMRGQAAGKESTAKQRTENDYGMPELKVDEFNRIEGGTRSAKAATAEATSVASAQGTLQVESSPAAIALRKQHEELSLQVKDDFARRNLDPNMVDRYLHPSPWGSYIAITPEVPNDERKYINEVVSRFSKEKGITIPAVTPQEATSLELMQRAAANYDTMVNYVLNKLPKGSAGRLIGGPSNIMKQMLQTDPQLAAMKAAFASSMEIAGAQMTQVRGVRLGQEFMKKVEDATFNEMDTRATVQNKKLLTGIFLENNANSILRRQRLQDAVGVK